MQSRIEFQENKSRIILHDVDVNDEGIINFDIAGLEVLEFGHGTAYFDIISDYWHVHELNGLGEYEYGIGIQCVNEGGQWIDKFYDDRPKSS